MLSDKSASELKTHIITLTKQFADENATISEEIAILEDAIRTSMHRIAELKKIPSTLTKQIKLAKDKLRMFDVISKFDKKPYILTLDQNVIKKMTFIKSDRKGKLFTKIKQDDGTIITYSYRPVNITFVAKLTKIDYKYFFTISIAEPVSTTLVKFLSMYVSVSIDYEHNTEKYADAIAINKPGEVYTLELTLTDKIEMFIEFIGDVNETYTVPSFVIHVGEDIHITPARPLVYEAIRI